MFVRGRSSKRTNASVNGVYVLRRTAFHGAPSYEKVDDKMVRYLFFSAAKCRWKISDTLDDATPGFAYAAVPREKGSTAPSAHEQPLEWKVFDGRAEGYNKDPRMRCLDAVQAFITFGGPAGLAFQMRRYAQGGGSATNGKRPRLESGGSHAVLESGALLHSQEPGGRACTATRRRKPRPSAFLMSRVLDGVVEQAFAEERVLDALLIEGRSSNLTNASINGIYALRPAEFHGARAFEKLGGGPPRVLFYSATKCAWKVSDRFYDKKTGFAYLRVDDRGKSLPSQATSKWRLFNGISAGWRRDKLIKCVELAPALILSLPQDPASIHLRSTCAYLDEVCTAAEADREEDRSDASSEVTVASSDLDVNGGLLEEEVKADASSKVRRGGPASKTKGRPKGSTDRERLEKQIAQAAEPGKDLPPPGCSSITKGAASGSSSGGCRKVFAGRASAKMLVRSGLRCACHFVYAFQCPDKQRNEQATDERAVFC